MVLAKHFAQEELLIRLAANALDLETAAGILSEHAEFHKLAGGPCLLEPALRLRQSAIHLPRMCVMSSVYCFYNYNRTLVKRRARGFRNVTNYINMIYFLCGRLTVSYPRYFT